MKGITHMAAGTLAGLTIVQVVCPEQSMDAMLVVAACAAGSLLPDIDKGTSKLGRKIPVLSYTIQLLFGHRGVWHSLTLWAALFAWTFLTFPGYELPIGSCFIGIGTHLLLDMLNPSGVPLFWPWKKRMTLAQFHSGGIIDWILGIALFAVCLIILFYIKG